MIAYSYNSETMEYIGTTECQIDPLVSKREGREIFLTPANAVLILPPEYNSNTEICKWNGTEWIVEEKPAEPVPVFDKDNNTTEYASSMLTDVYKIINTM